MKITVIHNGGKVSYVGRISFKSGHLPIVELVDDFSYAVDLLFSNEYYYKTQSYVIKQIYESILVKENVKNVYVYDNQFIRSMKIQKIKNLI
jgi:hypothetical protein